MGIPQMLFLFFFEIPLCEITFFFFFFNTPPPPEIYPLPLHAPLPISRRRTRARRMRPRAHWTPRSAADPASPRCVKKSSTPAETAGQRSPNRAVDVCHSVAAAAIRSEEHTSELQSLAYLVCRLLLEKK